MGHGDEIVLADAHFPGDTCGQRVVRADGLRIANLLDGILPLLALDADGGDSPTIMMAPGEGSVLDPKVESRISGSSSSTVRKPPPSCGTIALSSTSVPGRRSRW